jgi:hypothetical protein
MYLDEDAVNVKCNVESRGSGGVEATERGDR